MAITSLATPRSSHTKLVTCGTIPVWHRTEASELVNTVSPLSVKPIPWQLCRRNDPSADDYNQTTGCDASSVGTSSLSISSTEENDEDCRETTVDDDDDDDLDGSLGEGEVVVDHSISGPPVAPNDGDPSSNHRAKANNNRLTSPLPNGCHGRTSRYNSFCRRLPCFKGSNYCKLHYSLYQEKSKSATTPAATTSDTAALVPAQQKKTAVFLVSQNRTNRNTVVPILPVMAVNSTVATLKSNAQQDKRFTGSPGEIRCHATTTRGRACAYVAVHKSHDDDIACRYCHMHADYDKNPPARRNKAALIASTTSWMQRGSKVFVVGRNVKATKGNIDYVVDSNHDGNLDGSSSSSSSQLFPLLSMLSTDVWFNKRVIISTGPFMNRTAVVLRWGNGWVTVKLDSDDSEGTHGGSEKGQKRKDDVIHNRRSFELFLHPDQNLEPEQDM